MIFSEIDFPLKMKNLYLHIGTHKTGSTSIQRWLFEHETLLKKNGYELYDGGHNRNNHIELYLAAMRPNRDSFGKQAMPEIKFDDNYTSAVSERVQAFISKCPQENIVFTTEGLSLLRHEDELQKLVKIVRSDVNSTKIILYLRNKEDFLKSYRLQLQKKKGRKPSTDFWSALYIEDDTWLIDYQQLISSYGDAFGHDNIITIDYDQATKSMGSIIPSFVEALGLEGDSIDSSELQSYRDNVT